MKFWLRAFLALVLCLALTASPMSAFAAELSGAATTEETAPGAQTFSAAPAAQADASLAQTAQTQEASVSIAPSATASVAPEASPAPSASTTPTASARAPETSSSAPARATGLRFQKSAAEAMLEDARAGLDYTRLNSIEFLPEGAAAEPLTLSVRAWQDGPESDDIAAFVAYDANGLRLESADSPEAAYLLLEGYAAGTVYIRAALRSDESVYAEFRLTLRAESEGDETDIPAPTEPPLLEESLRPDASTGEPSSPSAGGSEPDDSLTPGEETEPDDSLTPGEETTPDGGMTPGEETTPDGGMTPGEETEPDETPEAAPIQLSATELSLLVGQRQTLAVTAAEGLGEAVWSVDAEGQSVVRVENGEVVALEAGEATVTVSATDESGATHAAACVVHVAYGGGVSIAAPGLLFIGQTLPFELAADGEFAGDAPYEIAVEGAAALADGENALTGLEAGPARITVARTDANGVVHRAEHALTVLDPAEVSVQLSQTEAALIVGETLTLTAQTAPEGLAIVWSSSDENVLVVENGVIEARQNGVATVVAAVEGTDVRASCEVRVGAHWVVTGAEFDENGVATLFSNAALTLAAQLKGAPEGTAVSWEYTPVEGVSIQPSEDGASIAIQAEVDARGRMLCADGQEIALTARAGEETFACTVRLRQWVRGVHVYSAPEYDPLEVDAFGTRTLVLYLEEDGAAACQLLASAQPAGSSAVVWQSTNAPVATVDENGMVTALTPGLTFIIATSSVNPAAYCMVAVRVEERAPQVILEQPNRQVGLYGEEATVFRYNASVYPQDLELVWKSSDESVATVDSQGNVTCLAPGFARIFVYSTQTGLEAPLATGDVEVVRHVGEIRLHTDPFPGMNEAGLTLAVDQTVSLGVTVLPEAAVERGYSIVSADSDMLKIEGNQITGLRAGETTITIASTDLREDGRTPSVTRTLPITVVPAGQGVTAFNLNLYAITCAANQAGFVLADVSPYAADKSVRWYIEDPEIMEILSASDTRVDVQATAKSGATTLYAISSSGIVRSCAITVLPQTATALRLINPINGMECTSFNAMLYVGETFKIETVLYPEYISLEQDRVVEWRSDNNNVALIGNEGQVYAVGAGTTNLYARTNTNCICRVSITVLNPTIEARIDVDADKTLQTYLGGSLALDYTLYLNGATDEDPTLYELEPSLGDAYNNIHYAPSPLAEMYDFISLDYNLLSILMGRMSVYWASANPAIVQIDQYGRITAVGVGQTQIGVQPQGVGYYTCLVNVSVEVPPSLELTVCEGGLPTDELTLIYGGGADASRQLTAEVSGAEGEFPIFWSSEDKNVATVDATGLVTATGIGTTTVYASVGGAITQPVQVTVTRRDGTSDITYRALVIASYQTPNQKGYMNFGWNSAMLVYNTIASTNVAGSRYVLTYTNAIYSVADFEAAVRSAFAGSKEGDVNIIFTHSHGSVDNNEYIWGISGTDARVTGSQIVDYADRYAQGHTILCIDSCSSGNSSGNNSIIQRVKAADVGRMGANSMSIITSTDAINTSGYLIASENVAYDFFAQGFANAVRGSGEMTMAEAIRAIQTATHTAYADAQLRYGSGSIVGVNNVQTYVSSKADLVPMFG